MACALIKKMNNFLSNIVSQNLFVDDRHSPSKIAIMENGNLVEFCSILRSEIPQIGSVHIARIRQVFRQHKLATAELENGTAISVRLSSEKLFSGSLALITITSEPWESKPARAILGAQLAGRYVILLPGQPKTIRMSNNNIADKLSKTAITDEIKKVVPPEFGIILRRQAINTDQEYIKNEIEILVDDWQSYAQMPENLNLCTGPKKLYPGLSLFKTAKIIAPTAKYTVSKDESEWQGIFDQLDKACQSKFITDENIVIWFESTKGLTAIDIDSASSKMGAVELSEHIAEVVMTQIRLRQISGAIFIDTPRLSKTDRKKFQLVCKKFALADIRHPDIYGFGPAGLIEMTVRRKYMKLIDRIRLMSLEI